MNYSFKIKYEAKGSQFTAKSAKTQHFDLEIKQDGNKLFVAVNPKTEIKIQQFTVKYPYTFNREDKIFVNGYQSWTDSLEYSPDEKMSEQSALTEFLVTKSFQ